MGIFADLLNSRPMRIESERIARRELESIRDGGDAEAPSGFTGRTSWAILKVLTLTNLAVPPTIGDLIGSLPQDIDYQQAPISPDTARVLANQVAIEDGNPGLEQDLLIHMDLCFSNPGEVCLATPAVAAPPPVLLVSQQTNQDEVAPFAVDSAGLPEASQSFTGNGSTLVRADFLLQIGMGTPSGDVFSILRTHSGTFGISSVPTGSPLITSAAFDVTQVGAGFALHSFTFAPTFTLVDGVKYCITLSGDSGDGSNFLQVGADTIVVAHPGNLALNLGSLASPIWVADSGSEMTFAVYGQ